MSDTDVDFVPASPDEVVALVDVQVRSFHSDALLYPGVAEDGPPGYDSTVETLRKIEEHIFYKLVVDDQIVGVIILFEEEPGHFHLDVLAIAPEHHNKGIGTRAMEFIEQAHPAKAWTLDTPDYATRNHHFYEKLGYVKVGELDSQKGFTLFNYRKGSDSDPGN